MHQITADNGPMTETEKTAKSKKLAAAKSKKLAGKVVLLAGGLESQTLIYHLAAQGADLALVYPPAAAVQAKAMQKLVVAHGQRCILIAAAPVADPHYLMRQVVAKLGSLDVFLDLTEEQEGSPGEYPATQPRRPAFWTMLLAAVQQMAGAVAQKPARGRLAKKGDDIMLLLGKDLIGNQVISVEDGRILGRVKDVYLDEELEGLTGLYLGGEGFLHRHYYFVGRSNIATLGKDTVLVLSPESVEKDEDPAVLHQWLRGDDVHGWTVNTAGGTKIGSLDDVILTAQGQIAGFALGRVQVEGPVAEMRAVARQAVLDVGTADDAMIIDLAAAEEQQLTVLEASLFSGDKKVTMDPETAVSTPVPTPYTAQKPRESYADHAEKSPYVGDTEKAANHAAKNPYITPKVEEEVEEEFKSPYTTPQAG